MKKANIYQIFYSEETRIKLDRGFIPLDNTNQRPDWREYWAMRAFLLNNELNADEYYGFFSPKFSLKTNLEASDVYGFLDTLPDSVDVVSFSPFFDVGAVFRNVIEQGSYAHVNTREIFTEVTRQLYPAVNLDNLLMDSRNSIFCNYFVAKPRFWRYWLAKAELIFDLAEKNNSYLGRRLNSDVAYDTGFLPAKIFVMERIVSLLLAADTQWSIRSFNPLMLPLMFPQANLFAKEFIMLDALKMAAAATGRTEYLHVFADLREHVSEGLGKANKP